VLIRNFGAANVPELLPLLLLLLAEFLALVV
jgi:hypothetical protein